MNKAKKDLLQRFRKEIETLDRRICLKKESLVLCKEKIIGLEAEIKDMQDHRFLIRDIYTDACLIPDKEPENKSVDKNGLE